MTLREIDRPGNITESIVGIEKNTDLRTRVEKILNALSEGLLERDNVIKMAILSAISGEHVFLLGPPGVAKSLIARRLKYTMKDGKSFEYLMNRYSTPDEVFGPVSISKLKNEDKYERVHEKYLPGADIAFIDEIWKTGPSILNTLLTILNERIFRNGENEIKVKLRTLISASNELPEAGVGLDALYDRFLVRIKIDPISEPDNFVTMILNTEDMYTDPIPQDFKFTTEELEKLAEEIKNVKIPEDVINVILRLRRKIEEYNLSIGNEEEGNKGIPPIFVSDRRWKKIVKLLRTSAYLNGRGFVDLMDCFLMKYMLWSAPEHIPTVEEMLEEVIREYGYTTTVNIEEIKEILDIFNDDVERVIYKRLKIYEPKVYNGRQGAFYKLERTFYRYSSDYKYIPVSELIDIINNNKENKVNIHLYRDPDDSNYGGSFSVKLIKDNEGKIGLIYGDDIYRLESEEKEKKSYVDTIRKEIYEEFEDTYQKIRKMIESAEERLESVINVELGYIENNLFTEKRYADTVKSKLYKMRNEIEKLKQYADEIRSKYGQIEIQEPKVKL